MTAEEFSSLDFDLRANYVWDEGSLVVSIKYYNQVVVLYACPDFFVEVFFHPVDDRITEIGLLEKDHPRFQLYLDKIDVVQLLKRS